jgi:hypothetical protein
VDREEYVSVIKEAKHLEVSRDWERVVKKKFCTIFKINAGCLIRQYH